MTLQPLFRRLPKILRRHKVVQTLLRLRPSFAVQEVEFNHGARLYADLRDANAREYFFRGTFEPEFFALAAPFLTGPATFFDVGTNFGFCTFGLLAAHGADPLACHAFEANADLCALLQRSATLYPSGEVHVNHGCVTDVPGESRFNVTADDWGRSFVGATGTRVVPNLRLDDYCRQHGIRAVAFTKMDVEGHEPHALRGAGELLSQGVLRVIYLEVSAATLSRQGFRSDAACSLLADAGYRLFYCKPDDLAARATQVQRIRVHGHEIPLAPCTDFAFPPDVQTDLLAIHPASRWV